MKMKKDKSTSEITLANFPKQYAKPLTLAAQLAARACKVKLNAVCLILVDNKEIKSLNKKYIKKNSITDVISFSYNKNAIEGDIYIASAQSKKQAKEQNHTWLNELIYLVLHGVLHLAGYTDYNPTQKKKMFKLQDKLFAKIVK